MEYSPVTVTETESFQRKADRLLSGNEKDVLVAYLSIPLYLLTLFGKNEKANITKKEKNILSRMVRDLVKYWSQRQ